MVEMTPEQYAKVKALFFEAVDLDTGEREEFLVRACGSDALVLAEVHELIGHAKQDPDYLHASSPALGVQPVAFPPLDLIDRLKGWDAYALERVLGHGGTSVVYLARDRRLKRAVALKFLTDAREQQGRRFQREAEVLARIDHPHVLDVHEAGTVHELPYIAMKLVQGPSFAELCETASIADRADLIRRVALGLAAVHDAGLVHRDVKPSNVLVERRPDGALHPYLADFGIARDSDGKVTATGTVLGTPSYLAPESLAESPVALDHRSDIYALGVTFYELLTGRGPYSTSSMFATLLSIRENRIVPPRAVATDVPEELESVVMRCLALDPSERFASAALVAEAIGRQLGSAERGGRRRSGAAELPTRRMALAVLDLREADPDAATSWLATALTELLCAELDADHGLRVIPRESLAAVARLDGDDHADTGRHADTERRADTERMARICHALAADVMVTGSYGTSDDRRLELRLCLRDTRTGAVVAEIPERGDVARLAEIASAAAGRLRSELGVVARPREVRTSLPESRDAMRHYAEGLARLGRFDALSARVFLESAVDAEPGHPLPHAALSRAWRALGHDKLAREEAERAFEHARCLSSVQRLEVEAQHHVTTADWGRAVAIHAELCELFPDDVDRGLQLAEVQVEGSLASDALCTLERLRRQLDTDGRDPRIDLMEARAAEATSDHGRAEEAVARAIGIGEELSMPLLVARAKLLSSLLARSAADAELALTASDHARHAFLTAGDHAGVAEAELNASIALGLLGRHAEAIERVEAARTRYREVGSRKGMARSLKQHATFLFQLDQDTVGAMERLEQALALHREVECTRGIANNLNDVAILRSRNGDLAGAERDHREALLIRRRIGDRDGEAKSLSNLAIVLRKGFQLDECAELHAESYDLARRLGERSAMSVAASNLGHLALLRADLTRAMEHCRHALELAREVELIPLETLALQLLGRVHLHRGDLEAARLCQAEALERWRETGVESGLCESHVDLGQVLLHEGRPEEAEDSIRRSLSLDVRGMRVLAEALFAQGRSKEARETLDAIESHLPPSLTCDDISIRIELARLRRLSGVTTSDVARAELEQLHHVAELAGLVVATCEAELALAESGAEEPAEGARGRLGSCVEVARRHGLELIAARAERLAPPGIENA